MSIDPSTRDAATTARRSCLSPFRPGAAASSVGLVGVFASLFLVSCGHRFSRETAEELISANRSFASASKFALTTPSKSLDGGVREGLWVVKQALGSVNVELTDAGMEEFSTIETNLLITGFVTLAKPARRRLDSIGGIKEVDDTHRMVEFAWGFEGLTPIAERYIGISNGTVWGLAGAVFELYDDGWRLTEISLPTKLGGKGASLVKGPAPFVRDAAAEETATKRAAAEELPRLYGAWAGQIFSSVLLFSNPYRVGEPVKIVLQSTEGGLPVEAVVRYQARDCRVLMKAVKNEVTTFTFKESRSWGSCRNVPYISLKRNGDRLAVQWLSEEPGKATRAIASATLGPSTEEGGDL